MAFHAYLYFGGNCREAFTRYQEVFGGELVLMPMSDAPSDEPVPADQADRIMHAALRLDDGILMASDAGPDDDPRPVRGIQVNYSTPDVDRARQVFEGLAEGGDVSMPMTEVFWSPAFGACTDRFGTPWMVSADPVEAPA